MKWLVYTLAFAAVYPLLLPGFLLRMLRRGGYAARFADRFALYPRAVVDRFLTAGEGGDFSDRHHPSRRRGPKAAAFVWIHAVSVGEVQVAGQLMREWRRVEPKVRFCFSTTSSTGWKMAEREITAADVLIYNPLDFPSFVKSALKLIRPRALILTESELWPLLIRRAHAYSIPVFLINARVSDRSAPRYRLARWFFRDVFDCFTAIYAQSELDRDRLVAAGADPRRVTVTGSFKFDVARRNPDKERELSAWLGAGSPILLGGSTWPGEDEFLLAVYARLRERGDAVRLVLAPRHFEKADEVEANIRKAGFACCRRSRGDAAAADAVFLADTTGELMGLYQLASVVFVGKSLRAHGSQNMIEPCLCGKPTLVGPFTENFRPVMSDLKAAAAIEQLGDAAALERRILELFADPAVAAALGERAAAAVARRCGVVPKCVADIRERVAK